MLILFDQGTPVPIRRYLRGHNVLTARARGWDTLSNGALLKAAEDAGFDLLLTTDKNLCHQQNLAKHRIAILVLGAGRWRLIKPAMERVVSAVESARPGTISTVEIPIPKRGLNADC